MSWKALGVTLVVVSAVRSRAPWRRFLSAPAIHKVGDLVPAKFVPQIGVSVIDQTIATAVDAKKPYCLRR
jgi:hypothetical protein